MKFFSKIEAHYAQAKTTKPKISKAKRDELNSKYNPYRKEGGWNESVVKAIVKEAGLPSDLVTVNRSQNSLIIGTEDGLVDNGAQAADIFEFCLYLKTLPQYKF